MSIKQTEAPQEGLLLLLPAAAKWLSGNTYEMGKIVPYAEFKKSFGRLLKRVTLPELKLHLNQSGTAIVRRKVGLDLDTLAVNLTGEGLLLGEFTVSMEGTDGRGKTSHGRARFKWALHDCVEEMEVSPTAPAATSIQRIGIASATPTSSWRRYLTMPSEMYSGTCMTSCLFNWGVLDGEHP